MFNDPQFVKLNFFEKQGPDKVVDPTRNRKGSYKITMSVSKPDLAIFRGFLY